MSNIDFEEKVDALTGEITGAPTPNVPAVADRNARALVGDGKQEAPRPSRRAEKATASAIAGAIAAITHEVGTVPKDGVNKFHGYRYTTMSDLLGKLTPIMSAHGIVLIQTETERSLFDGGNVLAVQYEFTIAHSSGEVWPDRPRQTGVCRCRDSKGGYDDKAFNKCHTAARKYFLLALFQIHSDEVDADEDKDKQGDRITTTRKSYPDPKGASETRSAREIRETRKITNAGSGYTEPPIRIESAPPPPPHDGDGADEAPPPGEPMVAQSPPDGDAKFYEETKKKLSYEVLSLLEKQLSVTATRGWEPLKALWNSLNESQQDAMRPALQSRFKPMALEVEAQRKKDAEKDAR